MKQILLGLVAMMSSLVLAQPLQFGDSQFNLMVPCSFDLHKGNCGLDTGANSSIFTADGLAIQDFQHSSIEKVFSSTGSSRETYSTNVGLMKVGTFQAQNISVVLDESNQAKGMGVSTVGSDFLAMTSRSSGQAWYFNFDRMSLDLISTAVENLWPMEIGLTYLPLMKIEAGQSNGKAIWDTGWSITAVSESWIKSDPDNFTELPIKNITVDIHGVTQEVSSYRCKEIKIGNMTFKDIEVIPYNPKVLSKLLGTKVSAVIGMNLIVQANWYIDYQNQKWFASPSSHPEKNLSSFLSVLTAETTLVEVGN